MKTNKKGAEQVLSFYWMIMMAIVAIVVASGVVIFYSRPLDIRELEGNILVNRIADCLSQNGQLTSVASEIMEGKKDFAEACRFNFNDIPSNKDMQYFVKLNMNNKEQKIGNSNLEALCGAQERKANIPLCVEKKFVVLKDDGSFVPIDVQVAILKRAQNAVA